MIIKTHSFAQTMTHDCKRLNQMSVSIFFLQRRPSPNHGARDQTQNFTNDDSMLPTELHTQPLPTKFS